MRVGITGHQYLGDDASVAWIKHLLKAEIESWCPDFGVTCLAAGADQLFAELLIAASIPYDVVVPSAKYDEAFTSELYRAQFRSLLSQARHVYNLAFPAPTGEAFFEAGKRVVTSCDVLFAVWNGEPARGRGGTGDVVGYAQTVGRRIVHIDTTVRRVKSL